MKQEPGQAQANQFEAFLDHALTLHASHRPEGRGRPQYKNQNSVKCRPHVFRVDQPNSVIGSETQPTGTMIVYAGAHGRLPRIEARDHHRSHILTCMMYLRPMAMARLPFVLPAAAVGSTLLNKAINRRSHFPQLPQIGRAHV